MDNGTWIMDQCRTHLRSKPPVAKPLSVMSQKYCLKYYLVLRRVTPLSFPRRRESRRLWTGLPPAREWRSFCNLFV